MERNRIRVLFVITRCLKSGPVQQIWNIINNLDREDFEPYVITLYPELHSNSILEKYKEIVSVEHVATSRKELLLGRHSKLDQYIKKIEPDVIHSLGVLPDYSMKRYTNHIFTCRNYVYDDYPVYYGFLKGTILAKIHMSVIRDSRYVVTCSKTLRKVYLEKENIQLPYIQNGVDLSKYFPTKSHEEMIKLREKLGLPIEKKLFVYGATFHDRKNHDFLLRAFKEYPDKDKYSIVLLGDGPNFEKLKNEYKDEQDVIFAGRRLDIDDYYRASDYYVSTSKSEGLPNGVLEAMASGLPVLLSDIEQHHEVLDEGGEIGFTYIQEDIQDFHSKLDLIGTLNQDEIKSKATEYVNKHFSAAHMSRQYQQLYLMIATGQTNG